MSNQPRSVEDLVSFAEEHVNRAVESVNRANPEMELEDVYDLYELMSGLDDMPTYSIEIELHEFELMQLMNGMMEGLDRMQHADELAFKSNMIAKLMKACPEHVERLEELESQFDDPRGFE